MSLSRTASAQVEAVAKASSLVVPQGKTAWIGRQNRVGQLFRAWSEVLFGDQFNQKKAAAGLPRQLFEDER